MAAKLYTFPQNPSAYKALIAAKYSGAQIEVISEPPAFKLGETNKTEEFKAHFPFQKVPALLTADGQPLYESNAIAQYVASFNDVLTPKDKYQQALVSQFINLADHEIYPASCVWVYPTLGIIPFNKNAYDKAKDDISRILTVLNGVLSERTFLVGERISLADITVTAALLQLFEKVLEPSYTAAFPHVVRWFNTCVNQPNFKAVLGEVKQAQSEAKAVAPAAAGAKKAEQKPKEEKKKEEKPKAEQKPKEEKKKEEKPAAAAADEEDDDPLQQEEKVKIPLDLLPKSTFDLDAFKRAYSNEETPKALEHFWKNFDAQGYSIWKMDYMYPEELTKLFMTLNLVGGFFQRVEKLRKYAFASICVFGEDNNNCISGIWVWRGQELVFPLVPDWNVDAPSYKFEKLDHTSEETKTLVKEYFSWDGAFSHIGKKFFDGKIFK